MSLPQLAPAEAVSPKARTVVRKRAERFGSCILGLGSGFLGGVLVERYRGSLREGGCDGGES